ncbi:MAG: Spy/CpxP family protein refolding chaperone [Armatimonadota bacterium]
MIGLCCGAEMKKVLLWPVVLSVFACLLVRPEGVFADPPGITPAQRERLKSLASEMRAKTEDARRELLQARMDLFRAYRSWNMDERAVRDAISRISKAQLALLNLHLENQLALRRILDASQFAELVRRTQHHPSFKRISFLHSYQESPIGNLPDKALLDAVGASPEQARRILAHVNSPRRKEIVDRLRRYSKQLIDLYSRFDLDVPTVKGLIDKIHDCQKDLLDLGHDKQEALRSVLTSSQFEKLQQQISELFRKMGKQKRPPRHFMPR